MHTLLLEKLNSFKLHQKNFKEKWPLESNELFSEKHGLEKGKK